MGPHTPILLPLSHAAIDAAAFKGRGAGERRGGIGVYMEGGRWGG